MDDDWRLAGNEHAFEAAEFIRKPYKRWSPDWDHDHCEFCWAEFVEAGSPVHEPDTFHEGFTTPGPPDDPRDDYHWVCPPCFANFRDRMAWTVKPDPAALPR